MTDRRRFLSLMGIGAASAPLAARELADGKIADLAGIQTNGDLSSGQGLSDASSDLVCADKSRRRAIESATKYLLKHGKLPDHVEEKMRDDARHVHSLEYDIANKRSWSLAVKVQAQRQRNYEREVNRYRKGGSYSETQKAFKAITGFEWPW